MKAASGSLRRLAPSGDTPIDVGAQIRSVLVRSLRARDHPTAQALANRLAAAVAAGGSTLDLGALSGAEAAMAARMPAGVWDMIGKGKSSLTLSADLTAALAMSADETLRNGMGRLPPGLSLTLTNPPPDVRVDLTSDGGVPGLAAVHLRFGTQAPVVDVHVDEGTQVDAQAPGVAAQKSRVTFHSNGGPVRQETLRGLIYNSTPDPGLDVDPAENLNFAANYPDGEAIVCRDLALYWHALRGAERAGRFSYAPLSGVGAIEAGIPLGTPEKFMRMIEAGARALCGSAQLGAMLEERLHRMAEGERVSLVLGTDNHALACELARKPGGECVVNFYDPNSTVRHERLVVDDPARLRGRSLADWLSPAALADYFESEQRICTVYELTSGAAPAPASDEDFMRHVPEAERLSPKVLVNAMQEGRVQVVQACLTHARTEREAGRMDDEAVQDFVAAGMQSGNGILRALAMGRTGVVAAYLDWVLAPDAQMTPAQRYELLRPRVDADSGVLWFAGAMDRVEALDAFVCRVLAAGPDVLAPWQQFNLLLGAKDEEPLLHNIADEPAEPGGPQDRSAAAFAYVRAIANSGISEGDKCALFAARHGEPPDTAAQAALHGNRPLLAAAMADAIAQSTSDPREASVLFTSLGVSAAELLEALATAHEEAGVQRILQSLDRWGLPGELTAQLRMRYAEGMPRTLVF